MELHLVTENGKKEKQSIDDALYKFNLTHFPKDLGNRYEEINLYIKDDTGAVRGGILSAVCWNWIEIYTFILDEEIRGQGYGTKMITEIERIAREKECDFIKVDTLQFQALDFYQKHGFSVFGTISNAGRKFEHYYLKKELTLSMD